MGDFTASGDRETRSVTMAPQDPMEVAPMSRSAVLTKSDAGLGLSGRSAGSSHCRAVSNKITGRRHRAPRKFVVTDLPDQEEMFSTPTASPSKYAVPDGLAKAQGVQTVARRRKAKMEVKGRFTIIDWSPDSPVLTSYRHDRGVDANSMKLESPRKRILRKQLSCNLRQSTGPSPMSMQPSSRSMGSVSLAQERQQLTLKARPCAAPVAQPPANLNVFDNHLAFLEKESKDMKSTLEGMVNTNAQWIEMLAKSGLNLAPECAAVQANETEPVVAGESAMSLASLRRPSFDDKYRNLELAYMELQKKYENVVHENERMEIKNIMLETRLQQQVTRAENLRGQLEKLTRYTENLIGDYSEPNYTGYTSDLNSLFGEQSSVEVDEQSPTAVEMGSDYEFNYEALKDHDHPPSPRRRRRSTDEECISDTSSEHEFSSGCEFGDNNRRFLGSSFAFDDRLHRPAGLTSADLSSPTRSATETAPRSVLVDPGALLAETKTNTSTSSDDDSMSPFPMFLNGHATRDDNQTVQEGGDRSDDHLRLGDLKRRSSSYMSMNMSTVSSTSSLASFGVQVAALSGSRDGSFSDLLAAAIARQRGEVSPPVSNQNDLENEPPSVLSKENLRVLERGGRRVRTLQQAKLATAELEPQRDEPILSRGPEEDPFRVNC